MVYMPCKILQKKVRLNSKDDHVGTELYPDREETEDVRLDNKRERHWRMVLRKMMEGWKIREAIIHAKMWYVYMKGRKTLIRDGYYVEVSGSDGKNIIFDVVDDHAD